MKRPKIKYYQTSDFHLPMKIKQTIFVGKRLPNVPYKESLKGSNALHFSSLVSRFVWNKEREERGNKEKEEGLVLTVLLLRRGSSSSSSSSLSLYFFFIYFLCCCCGWWVNWFWETLKEFFFSFFCKHGFDNSILGIDRSEFGKYLFFIFIFKLTTFCSS